MKKRKEKRKYVARPGIEPANFSLQMILISHFKQIKPNRFHIKRSEGIVRSGDGAGYNLKCRGILRKVRAYCTCSRCRAGAFCLSSILALATHTPPPPMFLEGSIQTEMLS